MSPAVLATRLRAGERIHVLDVRNRAESEQWPLGGDNVETTHLPYMQFVQAQAKGDVADVVTDFDDGEQVVVICGRGESSETVADALRDHGVDAVNLEDGMRGWARVYHAEEFDADTAGATVIQYQRPASGCLAYLVVSDDEAAVVDPLRTFAERYVEDAREYGAELRYALDTHVHADHVSGVRDVAERSDAELVVPEGATDRGLAFDAEEVDDGDELRVGDVILEAMHVPGHTTEMTAYRVGNVLLGGDLLFTDSVARPDLERGDDGAEGMARQLHRTLHDQVLSLPDETVVAPGHYSDASTPADDGTYTATLGELKARLEALSMDEEAFVDYALSAMPPRPNNYEEIISTNLGRDSVGDEEAFELELGPNNCAATAD
ncbi:MBL fold metallo-hydrolase [Haloprofundus marisrubri]|uniref:MBL fold metallo-hydrolase n=1 Tax=Haloprofundus marisrubri TaxID=1514971 RepID=A0A0W1RAU8_9EURY|nr:MBL fold metallo-hydrolase [Haloprofundus marisrubri]KTG10519.1 MBL fold metallo-hydrolase [Haloprofundus marisrubri]